MKKILALMTSAALCLGLTFAVACGDKAVGETVTQEQWEAAFDEILGENLKSYTLLNDGDDGVWGREQHYTFYDEVNLASYNYDFFPDGMRPDDDASCYEHIYSFVLGTTLYYAVSDYYSSSDEDFVIKPYYWGHFIMDYGTVEAAKNALAEDKTCGHLVLFSYCSTDEVTIKNGGITCESLGELYNQFSFNGKKGCYEGAVKYVFKDDYSIDDYELEAETEVYFKNEKVNKIVLSYYETIVEDGETFSFYETDTYYDFNSTTVTVPQTILDKANAYSPE